MELKNRDIEVFIQNLQEGPIAELKKSKSLSTKSKSAIYRLTKKIANAPETAAYLEQKQALGETLQNEEKTHEEVDQEFQEILNQNSGLSFDKPMISEEELLEVLSIDDLLTCDWLFETKE